MKWNRRLVVIAGLVILLSGTVLTSAGLTACAAGSNSGQTQSGKRTLKFSRKNGENQEKKESTKEGIKEDNKEESKEEAPASGEKTKAQDKVKTAKIDPADVRVCFEILSDKKGVSAKITGLSKEDKTLWTYKSDSFEPTELSQVDAVGRWEDRFYFAAGGSLYALDIADGTILWEDDTFHGASVSSVIDEDGTIFASGFYGPDMHVVDKDGKVLGSIGSFDEDAWWPYNVRIDGKDVLVTMDGGEKEGCVYAVNRKTLNARYTGERVEPTFGAPTDLIAATAKASSTLPSSGGNTYGTANLTDGRYDTAWVEGKDGDGIGEYLDFKVPKGTLLKGFVIVPGYMKSRSLLEKNGVPVSLEAETGGMIYPLDLSGSDEMFLTEGEYCYCSFSAPVVSDGNVRITIKDVRSGSRYDDTCISELYFY